MVSSSRLRSFENDLYDILDYELPVHHQIVSVKAKSRNGDDVDLEIVIKVGAYTDPNKDECRRVVEQYVQNVRYDYKEFGDVYYSVRFK